MNEHHGQKQHISRQRLSNYSATRKSSPFKFQASSIGPQLSKNGSATRQAHKDHFRELRKMLDTPPNNINMNDMKNTTNNNDSDEDGHVGLSLELEIDQSLHDLIQLAKNDPSNPNMYNQSLDVTFIQQAESMHQTTVSLGVNEVSQLIEMVNAKGNHIHTISSASKENKEEESKDIRQSQSPENLKFDELFEDNLLEYYTTYDTDSEELYERGIVPPSTQQVYTSPHHTFKDIKSKLPCLTKSRTSHHMDDADKPGTACLCQHCGMVGVLVESQKRPAIPHTPNPKFSGYPNSSGCTSTTHHVTRNQRKVVDLRSKSKSETNLILLKELTSKIASLEDRLNEHEEKTVRKDYFKFVIHKLLTQYSNKINELRSATKAPLNKHQNINIATQYSKKNLSLPNKDGGRNKNDFDTPERDHNRYYPVKVKLNQKSSKEESGTSDRYHRRVYKSKVPKHSVNTSSSRNDILRLPHNLDGADIKTVYMTNNFSSPRSPFERANLEDDNILPEMHSNMSAHAIKNLCNMVYNKYCDTSKHAQCIQEKEIPEKLLKSGKSASPFQLQHYHCQMQSPQPTKYSVRSKLEHQSVNNKNRYGDMTAQQYKHMDVSYVSPALKTWHDESEQEFATVAANNSGNEHPQEKCLGSGVNRNSTKENQNQNQNQNENENSSGAKNKIQTKHSIEEKIKYLRYLAKRKNVDEAELWNNILNQAQRHIKSNEDTVSIQLPSLMNGPEMSELELTLSKLKEIVKKSRNVKKNRSGYSIEYRTSSDCFRPCAGKRRPIQKENCVSKEKRKNATR